MATTYVVLRETDSHYGDPETKLMSYPLVTVEATNAEQARRRAAEELSDEDLEAGVTLIAVPERNWRTGRGTLKAETTRRIRSA
jgi:hypothetical protein